MWYDLPFSMLGNLHVVVVCFIIYIFAIVMLCIIIQRKFRNIIRVSNRLDPDQARRFVGPDLGPICLQMLNVSTDDKNVTDEEMINKMHYSIPMYQAVIQLVCTYKPIYQCSYLLSLGSFMQTKYLCVMINI